MIRRAEEIKDYIKTLEDLVPIHPVPERVKGVIDGLIWVLYGECDKPEYMTSDKWDRLIEQCNEDKERRKQKADAIKRNLDPKNIEDVLINPDDMED